MSDFERTFGAGADIFQIIEEINDSFRTEDPAKAASMWFETYTEAREWAKNNPGERITRHPVSGYEQVVRARPAPYNKSHIWSIDPDAPEISDTGNPRNVWGYWKSMIDNGDPLEVISKYLRDVVSVNGVCRCTSMRVPQPKLSEVIASLDKASMALSPLSKEHCMIEGLSGPPNWGENLAVLITEDNETTLWGNIDFEQVYDALTCKDK